MAQAEWLQAVDSYSFPQVCWTGDNAYLMERLENISPATVSDPNLVRTILDILRQDVWTQPAVTEFGFGWHWGYVLRVMGKLKDAEIEKEIEKLALAVDFATLPLSNIHGDPTFDNCMRRDRRIVIADPIPAAVRGMPPTRAVDVGKILQSVCGYETIVFGRPPCTVSISTVLELAHLEPNEVAAAKYFLLLNIARLIPYQPEDLRPACKVMFHEAVEKIAACT